MSNMALNGLVQSGLLARLVADNTTVQAQANRLTLQASSGRVSDTYGGLGDARHVSVDLRPQMAQVSAWQQGIGAASGRLDTTQSVLGQLHDIATSFGSETLGAAMQSGTGANAVAVQAKVALQQVVDLLNTRSSGQYVFAGTDSANPPINTTALATFTSDAAAQVGGLAGVADPASILAAVVTQAGTASFAYPGASTSATTPAAVQAEIGAGQTVPMAFVAGNNSFPGATGTAGTGSYVRDLVAGLAALSGLTGTSADEPTLQAYGAAVSGLLTGAAGSIANEQAGFGQVQSHLATQGSVLSDTLASLTKQVTGAEDVDMTVTATALAQVQTQLQASYKLIAGIRELSLTAYL